ncbi:G-type lectin S-receptor-like serine/threonine-protein kinase SD2-5 [Punica granatum]|uniref:Receptor-like serine/threonine-protein kinase n=1 Tax=Punica granatum TaxID=22663 RepID=A0A6P8DC39_PUNGR|nr:G-type lectin S-receptor-like serine/threonine-protein kinase SD2-5 [Punica granatum]
MTWSVMIFIRDKCFCLISLLGICAARPPYIGHISPGFVTSQMDWANQGGRFLVSNNSAFALGFATAQVDASSSVLIVTHVNSSTNAWTANRGRLISNSAKFVFNASGDVYLEDKSSMVWRTNTKGKKATRMMLQDSGNLVLIGDEDKVLWQSFSHPTDTLLPGQEFKEGMRLRSFPNSNNLSLYLEIKSGDLVLYAGFQTPQTYWSIKNDVRRTNKNITGQVHSVSLLSNSWNFYDQSESLLWQFIFSASSSPGDFWAAILGQDGSITFNNLHGNGSPANSVRIPQHTCEVPEYCNPYSMCYFGGRCQCLPTLISQPGCRPPPPSSCSQSNDRVDLLSVGEKLDYFALPYSTPTLKSNLNACTAACRSNCSCNVLFYERSSGNCFLFDEIGGYRSPIPRSAGFVSYVKIIRGSVSKGGSRKRKLAVLTVSITIASIAILAILTYIGIRCNHKRKKLVKSYSQENLEDEDFFENLSGLPTRFRYVDLCQVTKNFSTKVGQGGFGSVYLGMLPNGTVLAIKKLEAIGQGKKEFWVEVSTIGSIHHVHLVKLKGFCAEGPHRLLVYEYLPNGSLDRWIFRNSGKEGTSVLDWNTRFSIAVGIAKGLAYLHDECEGKIVHCDIKPQNILLDENFVAKVSDFGLAKLMSRKDSLVYTTLRGTRGYLAPEWITNNPISEKSDVYSYGMVLLEIIGGRKNYDSEECSEKVYFASYAVKMLEQGRANEIVDPDMEFDGNDKRVITSIGVAIWCIQEEMFLRPSMIKVVQMLEGLCDVPEPPISIPSSSRPKSSGGECTPVEHSDTNSTAFLSAVHLSGPR